MSGRLAGFALLLAAVLATALAVVWQRHQHRQLFVELSALEHERDELNIEFGRLQLELATLGDANRVEQIARGRLGMVEPAPADVVVVSP